MKAEESQPESPLLDPIGILIQQLSSKVIKKAAIESIDTIALVLTPRQIKNQLVPLLVKTFIQENNEMRVLIIRNLSKLLQFLPENNQLFSILEFIIDILCVFSEQDIRKQAFSVFEQVMRCIKIEDAKEQMLKVIDQLSKETDYKMAEVVLKIGRHLYTASNPEAQSLLLQRINKYQQTQQGQLILAQQLNLFITIIPVFPLAEIVSLTRDLVNSASVKVRSKLIVPILLLATTPAKDTAKEFLSILLRDNNSEVVSSVILQTRQITLLFPEYEDLKQLWSVVDGYPDKDLTLKTAIIQVLEYIPLTAQRRETILQNHNISQSLNLNKILATSLCKIDDWQGLKKIIDSSDTEFKNKLFPKLPPICQLHLQLMQNLFAQKNWRNKLSLIQNIEKRLEDGEQVEILLPKLLQQMGDRIAVFRMGVVKLIAAILKAKRIDLRQHKSSIEDSLYSKNWFQRQSALLLIQERAQEFPNLSKTDRQFVVSAVKVGLAEKIGSLQDISRQICQKLKIKLD